MITVTCEEERGKYRVRVLQESDSFYSIDIEPKDRGGEPIGPCRAIQVGLQAMLNQLGVDDTKLMPVPKGDFAFGSGDPVTNQWQEFFRRHRDRTLHSYDETGAEGWKISMEALYQAFSNRLAAERAEATAR
jgi:hypothetical protein